MNGLVIKTDILVPEAKYKEISKKLSCRSLAEKGTCQTFFWQNREYVATSAMGTGTGKGWGLIWAHEVIDKGSYRGNTVALEKGEHQREVNKGNRQRGYMGLLVRCGKREIVLTGPRLTFRALDGGSQLTIF